MYSKVAAKALSVQANTNTTTHTTRHGVTRTKRHVCLLTLTLHPFVCLKRGTSNRKPTSTWCIRALSGASVPHQHTAGHPSEEPQPSQRTLLVLGLDPKLDVLRADMPERIAKRDTQLALAVALHQRRWEARALEVVGVDDRGRAGGRRRRWCASTSRSAAPVARPLGHWALRRRWKAAPCRSTPQRYTLCNTWCNTGLVV